MLEVINLVVDHGKLRALWDVSFRVDKGERVALLGAYGAGKSTTLGAVIGLYPVAGGTIRIGGKPAAGSTARNVDSGVALVPEGRRLFPEMTVRENLEMGAYMPKGRAQKNAPREIRRASQGGQRGRGAGFTSGRRS